MAWKQMDIGEQRVEFAVRAMRGEAVRERLETVFDHNGLPEAMPMDHGVPWWNSLAPSGWTRFLVWLMRQGIRCHFSAIRHPETQGKVERFHQSLERARTRRHCPDWLTQSWLDRFRFEYNHLRPHEALRMQTPASRWQPSLRSYQAKPPQWDHGPGAEVKRLSIDGDLYLDNHRWRISQALAGEAVRLERADQRIPLYYCNTLVRELDLAAHRSTRVDRWAQPSTKQQICKASPDNTL